MHIVLDVRILETSTGRYMQRLVEHINDRYSGGGNRYTAIVPHEHVAKWQQRLPNIAVVGSNAKWYSLREQWHFYWHLRSLKPDLVHFTMPQQPLLWWGPAITTIHDMTLIRFENIDTNDNPVVYRIKKRVFHVLVAIIMRRASAVIVPTNFVKEDLARVYGGRFLSKIYVTHEAGEIPDQAPVPLGDFVGKQYICTVGNMFPYKNVGRVIEAFDELVQTHPDLHLLCAGKKDDFAGQLEQYTINHSIPNVHFLGFISDGEKRWLLEHAAAYVTASYSEGFCIPVLEAMYAGCPVVSSNASCLPETGGDAVLYFNPDSTDELVRQVEAILASAALAKRLRKSGLHHVKMFSWQKMVDETYDIYQLALRR